MTFCVTKGGVACCLHHSESHLAAPRHLEPQKSSQARIAFCSSFLAPPFSPQVVTSFLVMHRLDIAEANFIGAYSEDQDANALTTHPVQFSPPYHSGLVFLLGVVDELRRAMHPRWKISNLRNAVK